MRSAICNMSQTSAALAHDVISSHQCASKFGPRNRFGSSAENVYATEPLGQMRRLVLGSYDGRFHGGQHARMPLGPSTWMRLTASAVGPMMPSCRRLPLSICALTHSAEDLVFPDPLPPSNRNV